MATIEELRTELRFLRRIQQNLNIGASIAHGNPDHPLAKELHERSRQFNPKVSERIAKVQLELGIKPRAKREPTS